MATKDMTGLVTDQPTSGKMESEPSDGSHHSRPKTQRGRCDWSSQVYWSYGPHSEPLGNRIQLVNKDYRRYYFQYLTMNWMADLMALKGTLWPLLMWNPGSWTCILAPYTNGGMIMITQPQRHWLVKGFLYHKKCFRVCSTCLVDRLLVMVLDPRLTRWEQDSTRGTISFNGETLFTPRRHMTHPYHCWMPTPTMRHYSLVIIIYH